MHNDLESSKAEDSSAYEDDDEQDEQEEEEEDKKDPEWDEMVDKTAKWGCRVNIFLSEKTIYQARKPSSRETWTLMLMILL